MEEMRMSRFRHAAFRVNVPSSPLTTPATKAESGKESSTMLAYGRG